MTMKLTAIIAAIGFTGAITATAQIGSNSYNTEYPGQVNGISANGKYAAVADEDNGIAYLWCVENHDVYQDISLPLGEETVPSAQRVAGTLAYGVSDNGVVAGAIKYANGMSYPAYYKDGEWTRLPIPANVQNTNEALMITADASIMTGWSNKVYIHSEEPGDRWGQYFPVQWRWNDEYKEYEMLDYSDIDYLNHQGFVPRCTNADGTIIGGSLYLGVSASIPALIVEGKLKYFHNVEIIFEPFEFAGRFYCGDEYDEDGKFVRQIWTSDPDDPRIILYEETLIDGYKDDADSAVFGFFDWCDTKGNFYGRRTLISDVNPEENTATLKSFAAIYQNSNGEFVDNKEAQYYTCAVDENLVFDEAGNVWVNGVQKDAVEYYDIKSTSEFAAVSKLDTKGTVLGCVRRQFNEAIADYDYFPLMVVTSEYSGVEEAIADAMARPAIIAGAGYIRVVNAEAAAVYDMDGHKVAEGTNVNVAPGVYVVKAGDTTAKVVVK